MVQGVAISHISMEVVPQVHTQFMSEVVGCCFIPIMLQLYQNTIRFFFVGEFFFGFEVLCNWFLELS